MEGQEWTLVRRKVQVTVKVSLRRERVVGKRIVGERYTNEH